MLLLVNKVNSFWLYRVINQTQPAISREKLPLLPFKKRKVLEISEAACQPFENRLNFFQVLLRHCQIIYVL